MTAEEIKNFKNRITSANRTGLTVIIYDIIDTDLTEAEEKIKISDGEGAKQALAHARKFVTELLVTLDMQYELSDNLASLYIYVNKCINSAYVSLKAEKVTEAARIMRRLGDAFKKVAETDDSGPLMENTESVYAGLTYGKGMEPDEAVVDANEANRGFLV